MTLDSLLSRRAGLVAIVLAVLIPCAALGVSEYSDEGAKACIDCHETPKVMGILDTAHAKVEDPATPAAQKECQSCHGPSANHIRFPMQVANVHFGEGSAAPAEVQNQRCLECHEKGEREAWKASAHGFEKVVCSACHNMHDAERIILTEATVVDGCSTDACHGKLMGTEDPAEFTHAIGRELKDSGKVTCPDCHNPHGPLNSGRCVDCHARTPDVTAKESPKARRFHEVAERKETECIRCHKGIAHPIPPLVLQQSLDEMKAILAD